MLEVTRWTGTGRLRSLLEGEKRSEVWGRATWVKCNSWAPGGAEGVAARTWEPGCSTPRRDQGTGSPWIDISPSHPPPPNTDSPSRLCESRVRRQVGPRPGQHVLDHPDSLIIPLSRPSPTTFVCVTVRGGTWPHGRCSCLFAKWRNGWWTGTDSDWFWYKISFFPVKG